MLKFLIGKSSYVSKGITIKPSYSPLKCSKRNKSKVCQFPFVFKGEIKWDCIEGGKAKVPMCNVKPFGAIQTFQDTTDFCTIFNVQCSILD